VGTGARSRRWRYGNSASARLRAVRTVTGAWAADPVWDAGARHAPSAALSSVVVAYRARA
ncbi:hypothetical protein ABZ726_32450, partial [Streptomyces hundungensis]|uniref:hypothetical protein n=1 Tax=Streptomyces hundungensis TaxID=1077946 RepID=UPI0033EAB035